MFHDRMEQHVDENSCKTEIESFVKHGQLVPALGRPLRGEADYDVELIYGARRLFVARHLNKPLLVELRQMSDSAAIVAMDIENRHRLDLSPYERGRSYVTWLRAKMFDSQDDLARALKISPSQVSRLIKLAMLPSVVVAAFRSPGEIRESWACDLADALDDPQRRGQTCARARSISAMPVRPEAKEVLRQLLIASVPGRKLKPPRHDEVVTDRHGKPLFRIRRLATSIALVLPCERVATHQLARIRTAVATVLDTSTIAGAAAHERHVKERHQQVVPAGPS